MRIIYIFLAFMFVNLSFAQTNPRHVQVNGYYKSNGTYVQPHHRTSPNNTNTDNFSTKPNINPYTGQMGYIQPDNNGTIQYNYTPTNSYTQSETPTNQLVFHGTKKDMRILGKNSAKEEYKSDNWNFWTPYITTALNPTLGLGTTLILDLFKPEIEFQNNVDRNYYKGFMRVAKRKKILKTLTGFGLGLITNGILANVIGQ